MFIFLRLILSFLGLAGPLLTARAQTPSESRTSNVTRIDPGVTWGKWDGWGCSLCWWAKAFGDRDDLADLLYTTRAVTLEGQTLPGLGLNIVRYNAGACSWNEVDRAKMAVSKTILPFRQIEGFWLDGKSADPISTSWDWSVDANQRALMLKARDRGADRFELFSNSPMWWMLSNHNPSGSATGKTDNLPPEKYRQHAVYLATLAKYAKDHWGLSFTTVEAFNEPTSNWWQADGKQEGCHFSTKAQAAVIGMLRKELDQRGLQDMPISASDDNTYDDALKNWTGFDASTKAQVVQLNVHGYQGNKGHRELLYQAAQTDGKRLWNSECGEKDPTGLEMARNLNLDFHQLHLTAWCYWQAVDGGKGGGWGLIPGDLTAKTIGHANPKYFVLAHYSRHIRSGMTIIDSGEPDTVAAYDAVAHKLAMVTLNEGSARTIPFDLSKFGDVKGPITSWITEPLGTVRYEVHNDVHLENKSFQAVFPAHAIETFEIANVTLP
jgi:galactan endo-1,6-beta-galactosidase